MVMKPEICPFFAPFSHDCEISGLQIETAEEPEDLLVPERERSSPPLYDFTTEEGRTNPAVSDIPLPAMFLAEVTYSISSASSRQMSQM